MSMKEGQYLITEYHNLESETAEHGRVLTLPALPFETPSTFVSRKVYGPIEVLHQTAAVAKRRNLVDAPYEDSGDSILAIESMVKPQVDDMGNVLVPGFLWILNFIVDGLSPYNMAEWQKIVKKLSRYGRMYKSMKVDGHDINLTSPDLGCTSVIRAFAQSIYVKNFVMTLNNQIRSKMKRLPVHKDTGDYSFSDINLYLEQYLAYFLGVLGVYRDRVITTMFSGENESFGEVFNWFMNGPFTVNMSILPIIGNFSFDKRYHEKELVPLVFGRQQSSNADTTGHIAYVDLVSYFTRDTNMYIDTLIKWIADHIDDPNSIQTFLLAKPQHYYAVIPKNVNTTDLLWIDRKLRSGLLELLHLTTPAVYDGSGDSTVEGYEHGLASDGALNNTRELDRSTTDVPLRYRLMFSGSADRRFEHFDEILNPVDDAIGHITSLSLRPLYVHNVRLGGSYLY